MPDGTSSIDEARATVARALRTLTGRDVPVDADGDAAVSVDGTVVHVRVVDLEPPAVQVIASVVTDVEPSAAVLQAVNELNRDALGVRAFVDGPVLFGVQELPAPGLEPGPLAFACSTVGAFAGRAGDALRARLAAPDRLGPGARKPHTSAQTTGSAR